MTISSSVADPSAHRFAFGKNWRNFLALLDEARIGAAAKSLREMLEVADLKGKRFLDVGSGSGLFSLAARRLDAAVCSFDADPESVGCTQELKRRYFNEDPGWNITHGSILDDGFARSLGRHDVVYAWGVLHHTGEMWQAMENTCEAVAPAGKLFIAIYNDQGGASRRWRNIKRLYNRSPGWLRFLLTLAVGVFWETRSAMIRLVRRQNPLPFQAWREKRKARGMSVWHDLVDWVGGHPFEFARPEEVFDFCKARGFRLLKLKTCGGGHGCNEYVFEKE